MYTVSEKGYSFHCKTLTNLVRLSKFWTRTIPVTHFAKNMKFIPNIITVAHLVSGNATQISVYRPHVHSTSHRYKANASLSRQLEALVQVMAVMFICLENGGSIIAAACSCWVGIEHWRCMADGDGSVLYGNCQQLSERPTSEKITTDFTSRAMTTIGAGTWGAGTFWLEEGSVLLAPSLFRRVK